MSRKFYIQDTRTYVGNSVSWWRKNGAGYTCNLDEAWQVDEAHAKSICRCRKTDKMWPCDAVDKLAQRHFDMQRLEEIEIKRVGKFIIDHDENGEEIYG